MELSLSIQYSVFTQKINTAYSLQLNTVYRSSETESKSIPTRHILDSRGAIPSKTAADKAIQAQLNNLGREIKKVNEKVNAAQVGCEQ
ncbi:hypothetical protein Tco_0060176 [Tanacetum coccineum]